MNSYTSNTFWHEFGGLHRQRLPSSQFDELDNHAGKGFLESLVFVGSAGTATLSRVTATDSWFWNTAACDFGFLVTEVNS